MGRYERLGSLAVAIEEISLERHHLETPSGFERTTTVITLSGDGHQGHGEDVTYFEEAHGAIDPAGILEAIRHSSSVDQVHRSIDESRFDFGVDDPPPVATNYRRWAIESAALDLALKQRDSSLAEVVGRPFRPVTFVTSPSLGEPPSGEVVDRLIDRVPGIGFKLDPTAAWDDRLIDHLADTDAVDILDLKGHYDFDGVGQSPDPHRYERLIEAFSSAIIEDPAVTPSTKPILDGARDRIAWDYPIRAPSDLDDRPWTPRWLNIKPSRLGSIRSLCATLEAAADRSISCYGGGQFELAVGRQQAHAIASLWYPTAPNDIAPTAYHHPDRADTLPTSPLEPPASTVGLGWSP